MNTIPLTFNQRKIDHTVLGGDEEVKKVIIPVSCLVLNRTSRQYRHRVFSNLLACGFERIVSVEIYRSNLNTEQLALEFPTVKFIMAREELSCGEMVNLGMAEIQSDYVLVLQDDLCVDGFRFSSSLAVKLMAMKQFCICPRLTTSDLQNLPVRFTPNVKKSVFDVESCLSVVDKASTLFPGDIAGFYDRKKFIQLAGFDYTIKSPYWQKADLFFRAWLWGEKVSISTSLTLSYTGDPPEEDRTVDASYLRFYLKNLLPVFKNDHGEISFSKFFLFKTRSSCGFSESLKLFKEARQWVNLNKYRYKKDAVYLLENWSSSGEKNESSESV